MDRSHFHFIVYLALISSSFVNSNVEFKVYGGYPIEITDAPFMAKVEVNLINGMSYCGGSIISEKFILTAAHCFYIGRNAVINDPKKVIVRTGSKQFKSNQTTSTAEKIFIHERFRFDSGNFFFDIALINLSNPLALDGKDQKAIKISTNSDGTSGTEVYTAGWGENPNNPGASTLHKVDLKVLPALECSLKWRREALVFVLRFRQICALGSNSADACAGDSGGPLVRKFDHVQIGLVSYGGKCDSPKGLPGVYTRVSNYISWIENITDKKM